MNKRIKDLTGQEFGRLKVVELAEVKNGRSHWKCLCECGNEKVATGDRLTTGQTRSCGCLRIKDLTGRKFGRLTVIKLDGVRKERVRWKCLCECGNEKIVVGYHLEDGKTQSCGCLHKEMISKHHTKHGLYNDPLYSIHEAMVQRCYNKKSTGYYRYGGRGIKMSKAWRENFEEFYTWSINNGYKEGLTIDRIDNDGDYSEENCRWVTMDEQSKNKSDTKLNWEMVREIRKLHGEGVRVADIARKLNQNYSTIYNVTYNRTWKEN